MNWTFVKSGGWLQNILIKNKTLSHHQNVTNHMFDGTTRSQATTSKCQSWVHSFHSSAHHSLHSRTPLCKLCSRLGCIHTERLRMWFWHRYQIGWMHFENNVVGVVLIAVLWYWKWCQWWTNQLIGHLIIIESWFFTHKFLKKLHAARIDQLADSNEPAMMLWWCSGITMI